MNPAIKKGNRAIAKFMDENIFVDTPNYYEQWEHLMRAVDRISQFTIAYPEAKWVCDCKIVVIRKYLWREVVRFCEFINNE
jgi:hypothetical protein